MKYEWETRFHDEEGQWYCEKMIWMCLPKTYGEFDTELEAQRMADYLNKVDKIVEKIVDKKT